MPERLRYFTMGNALVVPLVRTMGKRISALAEDEYGNTPAQRAELDRLPITSLWSMRRWC